MCKLKAADFYYGAFLSALLNTTGCHPVLFDDEEDKPKNRQIYRLLTSHNEFLIYTKFFAKKNPDSKKRWHWTFKFSDAEVKKLAELHNENPNVKLALICIKEVERRKKKKKTDDIESVYIELDEGELAIVDYKDAMDCLGIDKGVKGYKIDIKSGPNWKGLRMYGSGRSDKINGEDNTLPVLRNAIKTL